VRRWCRSWLLQRVFAVDILKCEKCGGPAADRRDRQEARRRVARSQRARLRESAARRRVASVRARAAAARVPLSGESTKSGAAAHSAARETCVHTLKVRVRASSRSVRQSSSDAEIVFRGTLAYGSAVHGAPWSTTGARLNGRSDGLYARIPTWVRSPDESQRGSGRYFMEGTNSRYFSCLRARLFLAAEHPYAVIRRITYQPRFPNRVNLQSSLHERQTSQTSRLLPAAKLP